MPKPKRGETYCKSFAVVCNKLRHKMKKYSNGLVGCLDYGKDIRGDTDDLVAFLSILSEFSYCGAPGVSHLYKDWCSNPITLIALSDERDLLEKCIDYYFGTIVTMKTVDQHTLHTIALFLLHRLHEDLQCPSKVYHAYFQAHGHYTGGNYTAVSARVKFLQSVRTGLLHVLKSVAVFASASRAGCVSPFNRSLQTAGSAAVPMTASHNVVRRQSPNSNPRRSPSLTMTVAGRSSMRSDNALNGQHATQVSKRLQSSLFSAASICPNSVAQNNMVTETYDKIRRQARMTIQMSKFRAANNHPPTDDDMESFLKSAAQPTTPRRYASIRMSFIASPSTALQEQTPAIASAAASMPMPMPMAPASSKPSQMQSNGRRLSNSKKLPLGVLEDSDSDSGNDDDVDIPLVVRPENNENNEKNEHNKLTKKGKVEMDEIATAVKRMVRFQGNVNEDAHVISYNTTIAGSSDGIVSPVQSPVNIDMGSPIIPVQRRRHRAEQGQQLPPGNGSALSSLSLGVLVRRKGGAERRQLEPNSPLVQNLVPSIRNSSKKRCHTVDFQSRLVGEDRLAMSRIVIADLIAQMPWTVRTFCFNGFILYEDGSEPAPLISTVMSPTHSSISAQSSRCSK